MKQCFLIFRVWCQLFLPSFNLSPLFVLVLWLATLLFRFSSFSKLKTPTICSLFAQNQTVDGCVGEHSGAFRSKGAEYLPQELVETKKQS